MPERPVAPLVLAFDWPDRRRDGTGLTRIQADEPLLDRCRSVTRPFVGDGLTFAGVSELVNAAGGEASARIMLVPIRVPRMIQAGVVAFGARLALGELDLVGIDFLCHQAFRRLRALGAIPDARAGDLSGRERRVLELTAEGRTAHDIALILKISQRTVHAHLQNAGDKLGAANKTHTVVEALRHGQIDLASSLSSSPSPEDFGRPRSSA